MAPTIATRSAARLMVDRLSQLRRGLTPCMPCSFALLPHPRSGLCAQPTGLREVTVSVRWIPLVTAAYGTQVARPARTTMLALAATAPARLLGEARPSATPASLQGPPARGRVGWDSKPLPRRFHRRGYRGEGAVACGFFLPAVTARARPRPAVPDAMRTQRGPGGPAPQRRPYSHA
jgi:hypothetical protein